MIMSTNEIIGVALVVLSACAAVLLSIQKGK